MSDVYKLKANPLLYLIGYLVILGIVGFLVAQKPLAMFIILSGLLVFSAIMWLLLPFAVNHLITFFLFLLVLGLPIHTYAMKVLEFEIGVGGTFNFVISMWKDVLIFGLLLITIFRKLKSGWYRVSLFSLDVLLILFFGLCFIYVFVSPSLLNGFYGFRGTVEPLMLYFIFRAFPLNADHRRRMLNLMLILGALIGLFAVLQAHFLDRAFYVRYGYTLITGELASTFTVLGSNWIRPPGTFSGSNTAGFYFAILIVLAARKFQIATSLKERRWLIGIIGCLGLGLLYTLSRSGWLVATVGIMFLVILSSNTKQRRRLGRWVVLGAIALFVFLLLYGEGSAVILARVNRTLSGTDPSAAGRLPDMKRAISTIIEHPLGVGLGIVGARSGRYSDDFFLLYHTENYFLQIAMELGIFGGIVLVLIYLDTWRLLWRVRRLQLTEELVLTPLAVLGILTGIIFASNFLPQLNELIVAGYLWMLVGIVVGMLRRPFVSVGEKIVS